jgi:predicted AlkP superfamily phosphohydrolase/phosphomutase
LRSDVLARIAQKAALSHHLLDRGGWDLFFTVFGEAHCAGHQLWHVHDRSHPAHDPQLAGALGDPVEDTYRGIDAAVGRLLERVGPDTTVLVICSHGMGPCYGGNFLLDEVLRRLEHVPPAAPGWRARDPFLWCWQRTPEAVRARLAPLRDRVVREIKHAPTPLDATRRCFQVPSNDGCGGIRINLVGREPRGRIHPGNECDAFCAMLTQELLALVNVDAGTPVVRHVWRTADLYRGPFVQQLPDLLVEWNREAPIARVFSPTTGEVTGVNPQHRTGDHTLDGLFFAFGPSVMPRAFDEPVSGMDVAPTVGALLGVEIPGVEGHPITAVAAPKW